jgi:hypothetical protein
MNLAKKEAFKAKSFFIKKVKMIKDIYIEII